MRITLRVFGIIVALFICLWIFLWAYVTYNKAGIIAKVKTGINKQVKGKIDIGDVSVDFWHNFPNVSVRLSDVSIRDSLWDQHHHDFLKAGKVYASLKLFSLFSGSPALKKIIIENAQVYYYTDSSGNSNLVKAETATNKKNNPDIPDINFKNTRFIIDYPSHKKYHDIEMKQMECHVISKDSGHLLKISMDALVHGLAFNDSIGNYLKEKTLSGNFDLMITKTKQVQLDKAKLIIDGQPFVLSGTFFTGIEQPHFSVSIQTKNVNLKKAISLLTETTQRNFVDYNILQPIDISADLNGPLAYRNIPLAHVVFSVKDADIETTAGKFNACTFTGNFSNEITPARPRLNDNSMMWLEHFSGKWENILLTANKLQITNLAKPYLTCDLHSSFNLADLNDLTASKTLQFIKGTGQMDITYSGSLVDNDTATIMDGNIRLNNAEVSYLPRNISLKNLQANLLFKDKDLFIQQLKTQAGATDLNMNGTIRNLVGLIYNDPEKIIVEWNISTPYLDLVDFLGFLGKKSTATQKKVSAKSRVVHIADKIDRMLEYGTAKLNVQAGKIKYKKFSASNVNTSLSLLQNQILLNSARLNHAGGTINMTGSLLGQGTQNAVSIRSAITNVDIPALMHAFTNFGQDAITEQNMKGRLTATVSMTAGLSDKGVVRENSLASVVNFSVVDAELNDFEPFKKIAVSVFKKRDFSHVRFAELKNKLDIKGSAITINKMEIRANVFTMFVEGVYDTKKGTDMIILMPLRNLKTVADDEILINKGKAGVNVRLHAKTGEDGKLKVGWDPLGKIGSIFKKKSP